MEGARRIRMLNSARRPVSSDRQLLVLLAVLIGVAAGAGAIAFRYLIQGLTHVFTGRGDYSIAGHAANPYIPSLGMWFVALVPVVGGLIYGPLVARFAPEARGHGVPEVMLAVSELGGRIRPQVPAVKALASALCIATGGSVGREGPIVQIGSAFGSVIGQVARVSEARLRLLVACGAAGGIAATFNAPIAGVFFALEVILGDFETQAFGLVVLSAVMADALARSVIGTTTLLHLPSFTLVSPLELLLYVGLGALAGVAGVVFIKVLYGAEDLADRIWRGPEWARPAVGGALLGLLLLALPQMYGVGYPVLTRAVSGHYVFAFVLILMVGKIVATSLTISIGGSGGVFAPSLFIGAMLGSAFGQGVHSLLPGTTAPAGAYALVGMGAVFAGSARAPITAVIIVFELTSEYSVILPLMLAIVMAAAVSEMLTKDTIYTLKLRRRGIQLGDPQGRGIMQTVPIAAAMRELPALIRSDAPLDEVAARLEDDQNQTFPVIDDEGEVVGVIGAVDLEAEALSTTPGDLTARELAHRVPQLRANERLEDAARALGVGDEAGLPILAADGDDVVGWITHRDVLRAYYAERERRDGRTAPVQPPSTPARSAR